MVRPGESLAAWPGTPSASLKTQSPDRGIVAEGRIFIGNNSAAVGFHDKNHSAKPTAWQRIHRIRQDLKPIQPTGKTRLEYRICGD